MRYFPARPIPTRSRRLSDHLSRYLSSLIRVVLAAILACSLFVLAGCSSSRKTDSAWSTDGTGNPGWDLDDAPPYSPYTAKDGTVAVYWYICGSDLELRQDIRFTPTGQMQEMMSVRLPDNVTAVVQTGGAKSWHNNFTDPDVLNRFLYKDDTLEILDSAPLANMGDGKTLAEFLEFCNMNYPAEKQIVVIYDHGGGSCYGVAFDDLYDMDSVTLPELKQALTARPAASGTYELVGLSACLMGTIDTIAALDGLTRYYVASEESQLGCSWDYSALFSSLAKGATDGAEIGKAIANGYAEQCKAIGYTAYTTLSVIDMAYATELTKAYNDVGIELLQGAVEGGAESIALFGRAANGSENYGATDGGTSDYDMVDLGDLVVHAEKLLPNSAQPMLDIINKSVVYHVINPNRANGYGISCYFPFTASQRAFKTFSEIATSPAFCYYFEYGLTGKLSAEGQAYLESVKEAAASTGTGTGTGNAGTSTTTTPEILPPPSSLGLDGHSIVAYGNGTWWLELGESAKLVSSIYLEVGVFDLQTEDFILFGTRRDLYADWEYGLFRDEFNQQWGSIDGALCYMEAISEGEGFILYRVPVYHNGKPRDLMVAYTWEELSFYEGSYEIIGLINMNATESKAYDPTFETLEIGDRIEPMLYRFSKSSNYSDDISHPGDPATHAVTVTANTSFTDMSLGDGTYLIRFVIIDYSGTVHYSKYGFYVIEGDTIYSVQRGLLLQLVFI